MTIGRSATAVKGPARRETPSWLAPTALLWCVLGLGVAAYLTYEHYTGGTTLACPESDTVNCAKVTSSQWSSLLGIPVAPLGMVFFAVMLVLCLPSMLSRASRRLDAARLASCLVGLVMAVYLIWAELFQIHAICLWCTAVHLLTFLLFVTLLFGYVLADVSTDHQPSG
ncbi:MAG: vitamin K epoxide reductase family protein [Actinomycetota bacterium]|nr:vitamin K epoxide reductase family protein [Actinomycetota bacterium]